MSKRIFISDIHMGAGVKPEKPRYIYDWLTKPGAIKLVNFLTHIGDKRKNVSELVLVGDILDNWICPHDTVPPSFKDIFDANTNITDALGGLLEKDISVTFLEGNHDMYLKQRDLNRAIGTYDKLKYKKNYNSGGVYAAHGHSNDPFNKNPGSSNALYNFPLGYFISRVVTTKQTTQNSTKRPIFDILTTSIKAFLGRDSVAIGVFNALIKDAGLKKNIDFVMADGGTISADQVRATYKDTSSKLSVKDLTPFAEYYLTRHKDAQVVIFGHTHGKKITKFNPDDPSGHNPFGHTGLYANSGTWSTGKTPTYIVLEPDKRRKRADQIRLYSWVNNEPKPLLIERFPS